MPLVPVDPEAPLRLRDEDAVTEDVPARDVLERKLAKRLKRIRKLQEKLYADARYALLVVLQGRDASGKDGTIRHVFGPLNPQGCVVTNFKEPTALERKHDFLWRVHMAVPPRSMIGIFNRSQYEDVLVPRVHGTVAKPIWMSRYEQINDFERMLVQNNVVILKFFLHISRAEQRRRLLARIENHRKHYKFRGGDLGERRLWDAYTDAYRDMLRRCSTPQAPWYVVPADDKRVRDYLIAATTLRTLEALPLRWPDGDPNELLEAEQTLSI